MAQIGAPLTSASSPRSSMWIRPGKRRTPTHHRTKTPTGRKEKRYSPPGEARTLGWGRFRFILAAWELDKDAPRAAGSDRPKAPRSLTRHWVRNFGRTP